MAGPEQFQNPTPDKKLSWQVFNDALGVVAVAHGVNADALVEMIGKQTEQAILTLQESEAA